MLKATVGAILVVGWLEILFDGALILLGVILAAFWDWDR